MADILIIRNRERSFVIGETELGRRWLRANVSGGQGYNAYVSITTETSEEFKQEVEKDNLTVELR